MSSRQHAEGVRRPSISRRTVLAGGLGALAAAGGAGGWALNRYVIDHVEVADASALTGSAVTVAEADTAGTGTATGYTSDTATITIDTVVTGTGDSRVTYFVADVTVTDATIVRSAFAGDQFGENIIADPSEIAAGVGAVLAVNGDYYGFRDTGIVIRNGVAFRDKGARQGLAFRADGSARLYDETATNAAELIADGVWNTLSFGPGWSRTAGSSTASTPSRSIRTSATTPCRAVSPVPGSAWSRPTTCCSWSSTGAAQATAGA